MLNISEVLCSLLTVQPKTLRNFLSHISSFSHLPRDVLSWCSLALHRVSKFSPKSTWPGWSSWSTVSSELGVAHLQREPDHLWLAQRPVLAHGGLFQHPYTGARALGSASTVGCFSLDSVLCHCRDLGNSIGKHGQQYPAAHMAMRRALRAWHGSSNLHVFRPQKTPNFLHI